MTDLTAKSIRKPFEVEMFSRRYWELDKMVERSWVIPGAVPWEKKGFVPQGVTWLPDGRVAVALYHYPHDGTASRVAILGDGGRVRSIPLRGVDGTPYEGHSGGLAVHAGHLWLACAGELLRFPLAALDATPELRADASFPVDSRASYLFSDGASLWVGEFVLGSKYPPFGHHRLDVTDKTAWVAEYRVDASGSLSGRTYALDDGGKRRTVHAPSRVIFTRDEVQGFARVDGIVVLSVSYAPKSSVLAFYDDPLSGVACAATAPDGSRVDAFVVDDRNHLGSILMPAGSQDLDVRAGVLVTPFEGGANKYRGRWRATGVTIEDRVLGIRAPTRDEIRHHHITTYRALTDARFQFETALWAKL